MKAHAPSGHAFGRIFAMLSDYSPTNSVMFTAAYAGAISGMLLSGRGVAGPNTNAIARVAGAFAEAFDAAWDDASTPTQLEVQNAQSQTEAAFQDRQPSYLLTTAADWAPLAGDIAFAVTVSDEYFSSIGVSSPSWPTGGGGGVTAVTGTSPVTSSGGSSPAIGINPATDSTAGSMSAADKTKLDSITTPLVESVAVTGPVENSGSTTAPNIGLQAGATIAVSVANSAALTAYAGTAALLVGALAYLQSGTTLWSYQPGAAGPASSRAITANGGGFWIYAGPGQAYQQSLVTSWTVDPVNGSDLDGAGTSLSPVKTVMGGLDTKLSGQGIWHLPNGTKISFVNPETVNQENISLDVSLGAGNLPFSLLGAYTAVGAATTIATLTAKNVATGTLLQVTLTAGSPAVGQFVHNTTNASRAQIQSISGSTLTLTQPLSLQTLGGSYTRPSEVNTWAAGDAIQLEQPTSINLTRLTVRRTRGPGAINLPYTLQAVALLDSSGGSFDGIATLDDPYGCSADVLSSDTLYLPSSCHVLIGLMAGPGDGDLIQSPTVVVEGLAPAMQMDVDGASPFGPLFFGGFIASLIATGGAQVYCDFDLQLGTGAIAGGSTLQAFTLYIATQLYVGSCSPAASTQVQGPGTLVIPNFGYSAFFSAGRIWGPGEPTFGQNGCSCNQNQNGTYTQQWLFTGAANVVVGPGNTQTTAASWNTSTGAYTTGVAITPANLDADGGLFWPPQGVVIN